MKAIKIAAVGLSALMCVPLLAACGEDAETIYQAATELSYYDGTYYEELSDPNKPYYNKELWRRNGSDLGGADPLVLDDTARTGYYYAYVTGLTYSYSDDLVDWKSGGSFVELPDALAGAGSQWAPEVIYRALLCLLLPHAAARYGIRRRYGACLYARRRRQQFAPRALQAR